MSGKRIQLALVLALLAASSTRAASPAIDAPALLRKSDATRNGWDSYVVRVKISNFEAGKQDEAHLYEVSQKGTDKTYVEFLSSQEKGRHLLMWGDDVWIFLPDTSRPVRITPLERLSGNTSNGDVARTNYAVDYDAVYLRTERVNAVECHVLQLTAKRKGATYRQIVLWLCADNAQPVKADFFLASGRQIKSATFDEYQLVNGRTLLRRMTIYDRVRQNSRSVLEYSGFAQRNLPDKLFHQGRAETF